MTALPGIHFYSILEHTVYHGLKLSSSSKEPDQEIRAGTVKLQSPAWMAFTLLSSAGLAILRKAVGLTFLTEAHQATGISFLLSLSSVHLRKIMC